jgi:putative colanic acid biosynthesis UDP-glucose lipid carrier transferase
MRRNSQSDSLPASKSDSRITWIGSIMRKTSMDEMPQFFNVLFGNMSIVGPRPHMLIQTKDYSNIVDKYMIRHFVKPGITGWAQVNGYRGEITKLEDLEKRVEYDIWYLENWSLLLDIQVILLTVYYVIKGQEKAY